jgi:gamma-glutamylcyclotransferase (GGCT)/AIG2-like uncharacterized protein YtfP
MLFAVNGTLMRGLELNRNMIDAGAVFVREDRTAPEYRVWSIGDRYPGMVRTTSGGAAIELELWDVPDLGVLRILENEPPGLTIGRVRLANDSEVFGVLAEPYVTERQPEITEFGGWRRYIQGRSLR